MSKHSKSKRDLKRKRRNRATTAGAPPRRQPTNDKRNWTTWLWIGGIAAAVVVVGIAVWLILRAGRSESLAKSGIEMPSDPLQRNGMFSAPPEMQIDPGQTYTATIETEKGNIVAELYADKAPTVVNNFVFLARAGFYDGTTFHRVLTDFMAQGGDPTGTGAGGPGYQFPDEFHPDLRHDQPGTLSMANSGPNTNGSQFFITYEPTPWLDAYDEAGNLKDCQLPGVSCHAVFGRVIGGMDVLEALTPRDPQTDPSFPGDLIKTIRIEER